MRKRIVQKLRGRGRRWYRKHFRKSLNAVDNGLWFFQEFADIYGDTINSIDMAEQFFIDFMVETGGSVIVDFLDTRNWDCIRKVEVDKKSGLIWFYWQIPHDNPEVNVMQKMFFSSDCCGMCLKFDNVRFIREKSGKCFSFCVNGYTIKEKFVKSYAKADGWDVKWIDSGSSFFSSGLIRVKNSETQFWSFMNTPISSFWIIPKKLNIQPQDSEKFLYQIGVDRCETKIKEAMDSLADLKRNNPDRQKSLLKLAGNEMRNIAEGLFKLIMCFYQEQYHFTMKNYDDLLLGDLIGPLKKTIYTSDQEKEWLGDIARIANDLSHDSGNPVTVQDAITLYGIMSYFMCDFKSRIYQKGRDVASAQTSGKPSPKEYVKEHFQEICFKDEIEGTLKATSGRISYIVRSETDSFMDFLKTKEDCVLYEDGFFRYVKEDYNVPILKVWSREEVVSLTKQIIQKVRQSCEDNGFDSETYSLGLSLEEVLEKESAPDHLFTEEEVRELMLNADDSVNNKLVIDEDGYARIIQDPSKGHLYPVSQETWCAGNQYVGNNSMLTDLHNSYVLCIHQWLDYLHTGQRQYSDLYVSDDGLEEIIEEILKYYERN